MQEQVLGHIVPSEMETPIKPTLHNGTRAVDKSIRIYNVNHGCGHGGPVQSNSCQEWVKPIHIRLDVTVQENKDL